MNSDITLSHDEKAQKAITLVSHIQNYFVTQLNTLSKEYGEDKEFLPHQWLRDQGRHGGGTRFVASDEILFNTASVNVSQVHYDDEPGKKLGSASAISTIIHPQNPYLPSMHMHISWTQMKAGKGYWRMMADLNPAIEDSKATQIFLDTLQRVAPEHFKEAKAQGDKYFFIPALNRHRGVAHFYLENYNSGNEAKDTSLAQTLGEGVIDIYIAILRAALQKNQEVTQEAKAAQLAYHTLYLFQVLTLDRGTTSGLLIHDQNDLGIMGSLPKYIDRDLLVSWQSRVAKPQDALVKALVYVLGKQTPAIVDDAVKLKLACAVRDHYKAYPEALAMQASGHTIPDTVDNHLGKIN